MNRYRCLLLATVAGTLILAGCAGSFQGETQPLAPAARNIIFMVPDGMGLSNVTAARMFKGGVDGPPLSFETLPHIGYQRTYSANSTVTDSAAAASAWASGDKFRNGQISCHDADGDHRCDTPIRPTVLELARQKGMATGLVVTSTISHATPAAWAAHVHHRKCETEIARQMILETGVDVLMGGGIGKDRAGKCLTPSPLSADDIVAAARDRLGYATVTGRSALKSVMGQSPDRLLGLFAPGGKTPELFRVAPATAYPAEEPTLPEMVRAALTALENRPRGFFLLVEGSQIDWGNHSHDQHYQTAEILSFDEAVQAVKDWIDKSEQRRRQTLLIVVADHDTGGYAVNGPYQTLTRAGQWGEEGWTTKEHTGVDTVIWSQGPGSEQLNRALNNIDLYAVMTSVMP